jgi:hypothetical protein
MKVCQSLPASDFEHSTKTYLGIPEMGCQVVARLSQLDSKNLMHSKELNPATARILFHETLG